MAFKPKTSKRPADEKKYDASKKKPRTGAATTTSSSKQGAFAVRPRRHADVVNEAKAIWNKLRLKTNTAEENRKLMDQLMPLVKGKANEIALQHDASRVIQAAVQFGTAQERSDMLKEICKDAGNLLELTKSQYAHFAVIKFIKHCHNDEPCVKLITKAFKGNMAKLAVHAFGSRVLEALFTTLTPKQTAFLKQDFYGPHFALFAADTLQDKDSPVTTLESNLALAPEKKDKTLEFVRNLINKGMEKSLYGHSYFQELFAEYIAVTTPKEIRAMAAVAADNVIRLLSTRAGTRVAAALVAYGSAKDRKRIMKSLKGYTRSGLLHHDAYLAILRLVQLTDDTVSVQKNIFNELLATPDDDSKVQVASPLLDIAISVSASKLLLMLLVEDKEAWKKCFDPYEHSVLFPNPTVTENGIDVPTSRKDDSQRRKELIKHMREPLIELCKNHTEELLRSKPGSLVLREVYVAFHSEELVAAVIETCKNAFVASSKDGEDKRLSLFEDFTGHLAVKNLILADVSQTSQDNTLFASAFLKAFDSQLMDICKSNRGAFVVTALCKIPSIRDKAGKKLDSIRLKKQLKKGEGSTAGFTALLNELK
jgi:pumilio family protein 6